VGAKAVFTVIIDDYAEVWINGQMARRVGMPSPATIQPANFVFVRQRSRSTSSRACEPGEFETRGLVEGHLIVE
jgi:hypothetical protein